MDYQPFFSYIDGQKKKIVKFLNSHQEVRLVSHLDADGLCSAGIIGKLLLKYNKRFKLSIVKQLEEDVVENLKKERYQLLIFTDIGSGQISGLKDFLDQNRKIIILDHHPIQEEFEHPNLIHINPHMFDIDGGQEISASTLNYIVAKKFGVEDIGHLAIVGALGDNQEKNNELIGLNRIVLDDTSKVEVSKGLRLFGRVSKPLYRALAHCTDPFLPGISGDESRAIQFLSEVGIEVKNGEDWRSLRDLTEEEEKLLTSNLIMKRMDSEDNPEDVFGSVYDIKNVPDEIRDGREFATMLNSCGRQAKQGIGVMLALGEYKDAMAAAQKTIASYRRKIVRGLKWVEKNEKNEEKIKDTENTRYLFAGRSIQDTMIGTISSMIASSNKTDKKYVVGFANSDNGVKVSVRANAFIKGTDNVDKILKKLASVLDVHDIGGHARAGGAKISKGSEEEFMASFEENIKNIKGKKIADNTN